MQVFEGEEGSREDGLPGDFYRRWEKLSKILCEIYNDALLDGVQSAFFTATTVMLLSN